MSDSNRNHKKIGFSTGALEKGNYRQALRWLRNHQVHNVELSALRIEELQPLVEAIESLPIETFSYISFHAPSAFPAEAETHVTDLLHHVFKQGWNIIVHPDVIRQPVLWRPFGRKLLLENMDRRKNVARTADELTIWFHELPEARLCLDVAHARQLDTTLGVLTEIIVKFLSKIAEIHISELDSNCAHQLMSVTSVMDYRQVANRFRPTMPIIIESMLDNVDTRTRLNELVSAECAMGAHPHHFKPTTAFYFWCACPTAFRFFSHLKNTRPKQGSSKKNHSSHSRARIRKRVLRLARAKHIT